jgi:O-antigen ligase
MVASPWPNVDLPQGIEQLGRCQKRHQRWLADAAICPQLAREESSSASFALLLADEAEHGKVSMNEIRSTQMHTSPPLSAIYTQSTPHSHRVRVEASSYTALATLIFAVGFLVTAAIGFWVAYDRGVAAIRLSEMIIGLGLLVGLPLLSQTATRSRLGLAAVGCGWLAAVVGLALWVLDDTYTGAIASSITILLPFAVIGVLWCKENQRKFFWPTLLTVPIALLHLLLTLEHSAWLSLLLGAVGGLLFYQRRARHKANPLQPFYATFLLIFALVVFLSFWASLHSAWLEKFLVMLPLSDSTASRLDLWRDTLPLIHDYPFTGSGLGVSAMVYSTYIYLLHVPYFYHAHELFLQIAVEQGLPGLICFIGMLLVTLYGLLASNQWRESATLCRFYAATFSSLVTLVIYGLQDAELYARSTVPLLFIPFGFALALEWRAIRHYGAWQRALRLDGWLLLATPVVALFALVLWPGSQALMQADLGAVAQTKAELTIYHWPNWASQDDLRRQNAVDLSQARAYYQSALAIDPSNSTAHRRLGQLALSGSDIATARQHLDLAYRLDPQDHTARQLLGELYAIHGDTEHALALWANLSNDQGELDERAWWYQHIGAQREAEQFLQALQRFQNTNLNQK